MPKTFCVMCEDDPEKTKKIFIAGSRTSADEYLGICEDCIDKCTMILADMRRRRAESEKTT